MFNIRPVTLQDIDIVYDHAYQLAARTGSLSPEFVLTKDKLIKWLFGPKADWYGFVVVKNNKIVGSCFYCFANTNRPFNKTECLFLDLLFVDKAYRRKNIGKLIMAELTKIAQSRNITRIEFWCMKDNIGASAFYNDIGAEKVVLLDVYNLNIDR